MNHPEARPRQWDSLAEPIHLTKISEVAHEHSRPRVRTICERTPGLFVPLLFESQSGTLACNGAVFSDCSERIVGNPEVTIERRVSSVLSLLDRYLATRTSRVLGELMVL